MCERAQHQHAQAMQQEEFPSTYDSIRSKYRIIEAQEGFHIEGIDRHPVYVRLAPQKTAILVGSQRDQSSYTAYSLFGYRALLAHIASVLMQGWTGSANAPALWPGASAWAEERAARTLNRRIHPHWKRLHTLVPKEKLNVARAVFATTFASSFFGCEAWPELYEHPYLVKDIVSHRAAAVACHYALSMIRAIGAHEVGRTQKDACFVDFYERFFGEQSVQFADNSFHYRFFQEEDPEHRAALVALLARDWKTLYSLHAQPSKSLRRTLMRVPGRLPASMLSQLHVVEPFLQRPLTDRVELLMLFTYSHLNDESSRWAAPLFSKATRGNILVALRHLSKHLHRDLGPTREDIRLLVSYILDYCRFCDEGERGQQQVRGTIVGLLERSMTWHREMHEQDLEREKAKFTGEEKTALPPVPLPANAAISFLATVQDIFLEGGTMTHCIARYAQSAMRGSDYLFHVSYQGSEATVQVHWTGDVHQSYGPHNSSNAASAYGERVLAKWGKQLASPRERQDEHLFVLIQEHKQVDFPPDDLGELDIHPF